jgi:hypothetical protein
MNKPDLDAPLLGAEIHSDYGITIGELGYAAFLFYDLSELFVPDHIRDGTSLINLARYGKIEGLMAKL